MIERQVRLLRSQHAHILSIVDGLCKCMRWREDWVFDVLRECNLLNELLNLLSECLAPQVVESVHYCIVLLANLSPLVNECDNSAIAGTGEFLGPILRHRALTPVPALSPESEARRILHPIEHLLQPAS